MAGLRERQKADRNRRIVAAATALFREAGYDAARIEDIADRAEVSVGTFYNYFGTKGDVLLAIVAMEVEEVLEQGEALVAMPPADPEVAVDRLIGSYYDHSLIYLTKEMWRTAMALSIQHPQTPFSKVYTQLDARLSGQVCALVRQMQVSGTVRPEVDADAVGALIFNNLNMMFIEFVKDDTALPDTLKAEVARQNRPLLALISQQG